ncbi:MAG: hypothetical protein K0S81_1899 [Rhodospirillales bacterium]|nr:hypothetical protein [Rhodospirillales bacterium]
MRAYAAALLGGVLATVVATVGLIELLDRYAPQHLPAPAISNRIDLDEKLRFLRRHPDLQPTTIAVGSSSAMRSLYGAPFSGELHGRERFLNVAFSGAQMHEVRYASNFYLDLFPGVRKVLQLAVPPDFEDCTTVPRAVFERADARAYVRGEASLAKTYLKYFNPHELVPEAFEIAAARENLSGSFERRLYTDPFGTMPMDMSAEEARQRHAVLYTKIRPLDPACFRELRAWSGDVDARGARLVVVVPPTSPIFLREVAGAKGYIDQFVRELSEALRGTSAIFIDERSMALGEGAFGDAYHLLWPAARVFSKQLSEDLERRFAGHGATWPTHSLRPEIDTPFGSPPS